MEQIITSLLDQDLYKLSMGNAVFRLFPDVNVRYQFIDRGNTDWPDGFVDHLRDEIRAYCELEFAMDEIEFLRRKCPYLSSHYLEWLSGFRPSHDEVRVGFEDGKLQVEIEGPWYRTIYWEVPLMAMISELRYKLDPAISDGMLDYSREVHKAKLLKEIGAPYSDFGTRRRFSKKNHRRVVDFLRAYTSANFQGTSNVALAKEFDLQPMGTMAHEWIMFHGAAYGLADATQRALENWVNVYDGKLGIALTDTFTTEFFFRKVDRDMALLYDGLRHDSGDPIEFAYRAVDWYRQHDVDPRRKRIVFSDGLNVDAVRRIYSDRIIGVAEGGSIDASFGIGTNLTNDLGVPPMNMVIKMTGVDVAGRGVFKPAVKLSDVRGKHTGDKKAVEDCERGVVFFTEGHR